MMNLATLYMQADQDAKAGAMFDKMRAAGLLTESKDYDTAFRLLANIDGREKDAMALIDEGLKKGILQPSYDMYAFQGQVYYEAEDNPAGDRRLEQGRAAVQGRRDVLEPGQAAAGRATSTPRPRKRRCRPRPRA